MPFNDTALNAMADHIASLATHVSLHSADPGTTGTSETSAGRQIASWAAAATGDLSLSATENFTGGAASGPVTHVGLWSAATGGTFYGAFPVTGDPTFNAAGEYDLTALTISGS